MQNIEMNDEKKKLAKEKLVEYLAQNGHRKTPERFAILDAVFGFDSLFTLAELGNALEDQNFHVSKVTLYNAIHLFEQLHIVECHRLGGASLYEVATKTGNSHQICTVCGKMTVFNSSKIRAAVEETHLRRFRKEGYSLYVYGVCSSCQAKITRQKNKKVKNEE